MATESVNWNDRLSLIWVAFQTVALLYLTSLILDFGRTFGAAVIACLTYWMLALPIWLRHETAQRHELFFARWGVVVIIGVAAITGQLID